MSGELMLEATNTSLLIIETRGCTDIVVEAPHHAPAGGFGVSFGVRP